MRAHRARRMRPTSVARRLLSELHAELERFEAPRRARRFDDQALLGATRARSIDELWGRCAARPFAAAGLSRGAELDALTADQRTAILSRADAALARKVDLLGSGTVELGEPIDWARDY